MSTSASTRTNSEHEMVDAAFVTSGNPGHLDEDSDFGKHASISHGKNEDKEVIAKQEGRIVVILRAAVLLVLVASSIAVSVGLYNYGTNQEEATFEDQFKSDANKVREA